MPDGETDKGTSSRWKWRHLCFLCIIFPIVGLANKDKLTKAFFNVLYPKKFVMPYPMPKNRSANICGFPVQRGTMIPVAGAKSYVVTPYVEHRGPAKEVRAISVVFRSEPANYRCMLCCKGRNFSVAATRNIHSDHFGFDYGTGDILCPVVSDCDTPEHVAIYSETVASDRDWEHTFIPVQNQYPETSVFDYNFTVCISTMYGNYDNVLQVVQAMEMFRLLGVGQVAVYKINCSSEMQKVLDYYVNTGFVEIVPWPVTKYISVSNGWRKSHFKGDLHYYGQIPALNDCVYRYMYRSKYVALHDFDELIVPLHVENWNQLLKELEDKHGAGKGFEFENHVFPTEKVDDREKFRPKEWGDVHGVNILEHIFRKPNIPGKFNNIKVIANPRSVFAVTVHGFLKTAFGRIRVSSDVAHLYHFRGYGNIDLKKIKLIKDDRLRYYASRLMPAVSEVLKHVRGLSPMR